LLVFPSGPFISTTSLSIDTSMTASGHITAHIAQPVHSPSAHSAGKYPLLFDSAATWILFFGHTTMQRPQPLQRSVSIIIFPAIVSRIVAGFFRVVKAKGRGSPAGDAGPFLCLCIFRGRIRFFEEIGRWTSLYQRTGLFTCLMTPDNKEINQVKGGCGQEEALIERCRRGSKEAYEAIVRKYMKDAYFIAMGLVGNREDALDLSQEAFFRAYNNIATLNAKWGFFPWFYQILRNLCFSHLRKRRVRQSYSLDELTADGKAAFSDDCAAPEAAMAQTELQREVWDAVNQLDDKHREVIILRHFRNMSYEQMAEMLFCNVGTVTSRLYYARKKLKEILERQKGGLLE
jgi:RNA polymerase sigma-70 factor (ECF subfamily)